MAVSMAREGGGGGGVAPMGARMGGDQSSLIETMKELLEVNRKQLACLMEMKAAGLSPIGA